MDYLTPKKKFFLYFFTDYLIQIPPYAIVKLVICEILSKWQISSFAHQDSFIQYKKAAGATRRQFCNSSIAMNSKQQLTK